MAKYVYPAVFTPEDDYYIVKFPDIRNCFTQGKGLSDALEMANDALCLMLYQMEEDGETIPAPTDINDIHPEKGSFVSFVACDTLEYRKFFEKKSIKKTLTIPEWLNTIAERKNVNFSATLQEALIQKLGLSS